MQKRVVEADAKNGRTLSFEIDFPETLKEMQDAWGEETVKNMATRAAVIQLQGRVRGLLKKVGDDKLSDKDVIKNIADWKPSEGRMSMTPAEKIKAMIDKSGLDKAELLALLNE